MNANFYSRPCERGDASAAVQLFKKSKISTHAPARGATKRRISCGFRIHLFLLTPLREGRLCDFVQQKPVVKFLLTPLREGRPEEVFALLKSRLISTHAPARGATCSKLCPVDLANQFLLTPLREGRRSPPAPLSRGHTRFLLTPLREGRQKRVSGIRPL